MLFVVLAAATLAAGAMAQQTTGTVKGVLTDNSGAVIPAATINLNGSGAAKTTQSQANGSYTFVGLQPGQYTVHVTFPGFNSFDQAVTVAAGGVSQVPIQLSVSAEKQEVTIKGEPGPSVSVEPDNNATALVLKGEDLQALPDDPDDLADALQALAGPAAGPGGGSIYIDGFSGGQLPPKESIREIRINQNPFSAEYDRLGFGRIEILTKPGFDRYRGMLMLSDSDAVFNSRNPFSTNKPDYSRRSYWGNIGGPMGHKASFFLDVNRRQTNDNSLVNADYVDPHTLGIVPIQTSIVTPSYRTEIAPRVDYQLSTNNTLTARFEYGWSSRDNTGISGFRLPQPYADMGYNTSGNQENLMLTETAVLNTHVVYETRFQYARSYSEIGGNLLPQVSVAGSFTAGGNNMGAEYTRNAHYEMQNNTTISHNAHTIRFGIRSRREGYINESPQGFAGDFTFNGGLAPELGANNQAVLDASGNPVMIQIQGIEQYRRTLLFQGMGDTPAQIRSLGGMPSQFLLQAGDPYGSIVRWDIAPWILDDWRVKPNFTLSLGLRYEWQTLISDNRDVAPRIGFAWAPGSPKNGRQKTVIRGGFGIFYDRLTPSTFINPLEYNGSRQLNYVVTSPNFFQTATPAAGWVPLALAAGTPLTAGQNAIYSIDPKLRADAMYQSAIGVERQISRSTTVSATFTNTRGTHLLQTVPINAPLPGTYIPGQPNSGVRPYGNAAGNLFQYESGGLMKQNIWMFNFNTQVIRNLSLQGNYSYTQANDLPSTPTDPYNFMADWGRAEFNHKHRFFMAGSYLAPLKISISPFVVVQSGSPYDITMGQDLFGDTLTNVRPALASGPGPNVVCPPGNFGCFNLAPSVTAANFAPRDYLTQGNMVSVNARISRTWGFGPVRGQNNAMSSDHSDHGSHGSHSDHGGGPGGGGMRMGSSGGHFGGFGGTMTEHRFNLTLGLMANNLLNHLNPGSYVGVINSPKFGQPQAVYTGFGGFGSSGTGADNRTLDLSLRLNF